MKKNKIDILTVVYGLLPVILIVYMFFKSGDNIFDLAGDVFFFALIIFVAITLLFFKNSILRNAFIAFNIILSIFFMFIMPKFDYRPASHQVCSNGPGYDSGSIDTDYDVKCGEVDKDYIYICETKAKNGKLIKVRCHAK